MSIRSFAAAVVATLGLVATKIAFGEVGDTGDCAPSSPSEDREVVKLCEMIIEKFGSRQGPYVQLGDGFYLVSVEGTGRVSQGVYLANTKAGMLNQFGGYGSPEIIEVNRHGDGRLWISYTMGSMSRGEFWETVSLLERRVNPVTNAPYLIRHRLREERGLSEEMQGFCSSPENNTREECTDLGDTIYLRPDQVDALRAKAAAMDAAAVQELLAAHQRALDLHKREDHDGPPPFSVLEDADVWSIVDANPDGLARERYVEVLNDYAFLAYQYGDGRNDLAIEILDKVITLVPGRAVAYLNMAEALEHLAKFGETQYATMPLDDATIIAVRAAAASYRAKHRMLVSGVE